MRFVTKVFANFPIGDRKKSTSTVVNWLLFGSSMS